MPSCLFLSLRYRGWMAVRLEQQSVALTACSVVAASAYTWDCIITFGDEIEFIWRQAWSWPTALFLCIRYLTFGFLGASLYMLPARKLSRTTCESLDALATAGAFAFVILVCVILQLRIYSMYGRSKRILYINGTIFAMCIAAAAAVVATFFPQEQFLELAEPINGSCYFYMGVSLSMGLFPPLAFSLYLTILAAWKWREHISGPVGKSKQGSALFGLLVQSNLAYLALLTIAIATVLATQVHIKTEPSSSVISLMTAAAAIGGTRLTLTLRREVLSNPGSRSRNTLSSSNEERVETGGRECSRDYGDMSLGYSEFTGGRRSLGTRGGCPPTPTRRSTGASSSSMQTQKAPKPNVGAMSSMEFWDTLRESWQVGSAQGRGTATV